MSLGDWARAADSLAGRFAAQLGNAVNVARVLELVDATRHAASHARQVTGLFPGRDGALGVAHGRRCAVVRARAPVKAVALFGLALQVPKLVERVRNLVIFGFARVRHVLRLDELGVGRGVLPPALGAQALDRLRPRAPGRRERVGCGLLRCRPLARHRNAVCLSVLHHLLDFILAGLRVLVLARCGVSAPASVAVCSFVFLGGGPTSLSRPARAGDLGGVLLCLGRVVLSRPQPAAALDTWVVGSRREVARFAHLHLRVPVPVALDARFVLFRKRELAQAAGRAMQQPPVPHTVQAALHEIRLAALQQLLVDTQPVLELVHRQFLPGLLQGALGGGLACACDGAGVRAVAHAGLGGARGRRGRGAARGPCGAGGAPSEAPVEGPEGGRPRRPLRHRRGHRGVECLVHAALRGARELAQTLDIVERKARVRAVGVLEAVQVEVRHERAALAAPVFLRPADGTLVDSLAAGPAVRAAGGRQLHAPLGGARPGRCRRSLRRRPRRRGLAHGAVLPLPAGCSS
mmetsp:Transcript_9911/g.28022  ORF Transcript_9911/g.28022 Transcript_9911/m.28022 type:complete len:520 (-) Transcript_9911:13-1572(-)